jgi:ribosomal protein S18 acetylase RimI-like enzyme
LIEIRPLTGVPFEVIFDCFAQGFSDYVIRMQPSRDDLREMLTRRGYVPELSVGAFDGEQLVGFTFNAVDGDRAYNSGTAVIPTHRRRGIARQLMIASFELLAPRTYILEVLQANTAAVALYESLGFTRTRPLQIWSFTAQTPTRITELANPDLDLIRSWCDVAPSWQNDVPSIRRTRDPYVVLGTPEAAAILFPHTGDLPLLAIAPAARLQGLGRLLLNAAATRAHKPLRIVNVDGRDPGIAQFLDRCGAGRGAGQWEMMRTL